VFIFECAVHRQCWTDRFAELVSTGVVMYRMVVGVEGCFKGGTSDLYHSYQYHILVHLRVNFCQR